MFSLNITEPAERDIRSAYEWWSQNRSAEQAERWYENIYHVIDTLRKMPLHCPHAPESKLHPSGLRQLLFGIGRRPTHRILFAVENDVVIVLRVRHTSQQDLSESDLE